LQIRARLKNEGRSGQDFDGLRRVEQRAWAKQDFWSTGSIRRLKSPRGEAAARVMQRNWKSEMADWAGQLIMAQRQVTEIGKRIARQEQQPCLDGASASQSTRLLRVLQQSLARAKIHVEFIEREIAVEAGDAEFSTAKQPDMRAQRPDGRGGGGRDS
jgi:hypothetical protein